MLANLPINVLMIDIKVEWLSVKVILALQASLSEGKNGFNKFDCKVKLWRFLLLK